MINHVGTVSIFVEDQQRAKAFYTEKLGMGLRADAPLNPGAETRWIAVAPKDAATEIILYLPDENWDQYRETVGKSQALTLDVIDMAATVETSKANGVVFTQVPDVQPRDTFAMFQDSEGNTLLLVEQPKQE